MKLSTGVAASAAFLSLVSCGNMPSGGSGPSAQLTPAVAGSLKSCGVLAVRFEFANTQIDSAEPVLPGAVSLNGITVAQHCLVKGQMFKRKGTDGQDYAIAFEARLPQEWNGRFFH
jgi:feruloyl esterase